MLNTLSCAFFGHRDFCMNNKYEQIMEKILYQLLKDNEYVEFLVGRNGEFDRFAASCVRRAKKNFGDDNSALVLVLPYETAEFSKNKEYFEKYYDEIEIFDAAYYKSAMYERNCSMVDRADLIICYVENNSGGAYKAIRYAEKRGKKIINLAVSEK